MKTKSKVGKPAATPNGTAGNPPTATPSATGTTRTRAAVATVMSDRNGSRTAVDSARPASVTIQPATRRRLRLPMSTREAYGRSGPPARSRQDRVRNVPPRINRVLTASLARAGERINDTMSPRPRSNGRAAVPAASDRSAPVVIRWPSDQERRRDLADLGAPRLPLVDSDASPPICTAPLQDLTRPAPAQRRLEPPPNA